MRADIGRDHTVELPCGCIRYFDVREEDGQMFAWIVRNSANPKDRRDFYGGKLTENRTQFVSRCVLGEKLLILEHLPVGRLNWHVHDEAIIRVPARHAEEMLVWTLAKFREPVPWAPEIPLAAEGTISDKYDK
jgi:DNA polymerase